MRILLIACLPICLAVVLASPVAGSLYAEDLAPQQLADQRVVLPEEDLETVVLNPGIGWESNNTVRTPELDLSKAPRSKIAYYKYYLKTFLKPNGEIDLSSLEQDLQRSHAAGQQLAFRLMAYGEEEGGEILRSFGATKGQTYRYDDGSYHGPDLWAPDLDAPETLAVLDRLLRRLGATFDGHPDISHIDIGYVGLWGEWHNSDTTPRVRMPTEETQRRIIDMHFNAFPSTRKIMQLQQAPALRYAISKGAGIRGDCLGAPESTMMKLYPLTLLAARAEEAWKDAPVIFEICYRLGDWESRGWNPSAIFNYALERYHASAINTKDAEVPASIRPALDAFLRRAGYRFVVRRVSYPTAPERFRRLLVQTEWENVGSAPCYDNFHVVLKLQPRHSEEAKLYPQAAELCGREPGKFALQFTIPPTTNLSAGEYELFLGVARGKSTAPDVALAIRGMQNQWYPVGTLELRASEQH